MRLLGVLSALLLIIALGEIVQGGKPAAQTAYDVQVVVKEGDPEGSAEAGTVVALAEPSLAVVANRPAELNVGGDTMAAGETLWLGTWLKLRVKPVNGQEVQVKGSLACSHLLEKQEDFGATMALHAHFDRRMTLGETAVLPMNGAAGPKRWIEVTVKESTGGPQRQPDLRIFDAPRAPIR